MGLKLTHLRLLRTLEASQAWRGCVVYLSGPLSSDIWGRMWRFSSGWMKSLFWFAKGEFWRVAFTLN